MKWQTLQVLFLQRWTERQKVELQLRFRQNLEFPVKYVGVGETIKHVIVQKFDADEFVNALFYREDEEK